MTTHQPTPADIRTFADTDNTYGNPAHDMTAEVARLTRELREMTFSRDVAITLANDLTTQRDAARADAEQLAEALQSCHYALQESLQSPLEEPPALTAHAQATGLRQAQQ